MTPGSSFSKKTAKVAVASTLGIALLVGGGTYALWSANTQMSSEATITAGDLQATAVSSQKWMDITNPASVISIDDISKFLLVPGDTIQLKQDLNVVVIGDNISGTLKVKAPNNTASEAILKQAKFTLRLLDKNGEELGAVTPEVNTLNSLEVNVGNLPTTTAAGDLYTVELSVSLPNDSNNATKIQASELQNLQILLEQGGPYASSNPVLFKVATGYEHTLALDSAGHIWGWGTNQTSQIGFGASHPQATPFELQTSSKFITVSAGMNHSAAIDENGGLYTWGKDDYGQLGNGASTSTVNKPTQIMSDTKFVSVVASGYKTLALDESGQLWITGSGAFGEFGNGTSGVGVMTQTPIKVFEGKKVKEVSIGVNGIVTVIDTKGQLWGWGYNMSGAFGTGTPTKVTTPIQIAPEKKFMHVSAGNASIAAIDEVLRVTA